MNSALKTKPTQTPMALSVYKRLAYLPALFYALFMNFNPPRRMMAFSSKLAAMFERVGFGPCNFESNIQDKETASEDVQSSRKKVKGLFSDLDVLLSINDYPLDSCWA
jgi:hypothetical protein